MPFITDTNGLVKLDSNVEPEVIALAITGVTPKVDVNPAGGQIFTITGTNFPNNIDDVTLTILFNSETRCVPISVTPTEIQCKSEKFTQTSRRMLVDIGLEITIEDDAGGATASDTGFALDPDPISVESVSPPTVSPIEFRTIDIVLDASFPSVLTVEDFTVTLKPVELEPTLFTILNGGVRQLNVVSVDDATKTITVKYGGAYSGTYDIEVISDTQGTIDTSSVQLIVVFEITDFTPKTGSVFGGTLLTITGGPFTTAQETLVKAGFEVEGFCEIDPETITRTSL